MLPSKEEAENMLFWARDKNPGIWIEHSKAVARAASIIALKCNLDTDRAYVSGILHDIGYYSGYRSLFHVYSGYELLVSKGFNEVAEICLSHSFPCRRIEEFFGKNDCTEAEASVIQSYLSSSIYNDYDKLIQLCDAVGTSKGISTIDVRMMDVIRRHGFNDYSLEKIEAIYRLKAYFDMLCGVDIYELFYDEICRNILM